MINKIYTIVVLFITHPGVLCKFNSATDDLNTRAISIAGDIITEKFPAFGVDRGFITFHPSPEEWEKLIKYYDLLESLVDEEEIQKIGDAHLHIQSITPPKKCTLL